MNIQALSESDIQLRKAYYAQHPEARKEVLLAAQQLQDLGQQIAQKQAEALSELAESRIQAGKLDNVDDIIKLRLPARVDTDSSVAQWLNLAISVKKDGSVGLKQVEPGAEGALTKHEVLAILTDIVKDKVAAETKSFSQNK